jgi:hypothetical protein
MKIRTSIALLFSAALIGCGAPQNETNATGEAAPETTETSKPDLQLNKGEKWKVNEEMAPFIRASEEMLLDFGNKGNSDFEALGLTLKDNNTNLISSCNMSGAAHNELHKWLMPQLELVAALQDAKTDQEAGPVVDELRKSFETFNSYFE